MLAMTGKALPTVCGLYCDSCDHLGDECKGCTDQQGKVFWTEFVNIACCPIYDCCVNNLNLPHCGHCERLVCDLFTKFRDPEMSDEDVEISLARQEQELRARKAAMQ